MFSVCLKLKYWLMGESIFGIFFFLPPKWFAGRISVRIAYSNNPSWWTRLSERIATVRMSILLFADDGWFWYMSSDQERSRMQIGEPTHVGNHSPTSLLISATKKSYFLFIINSSTIIFTSLVPVYFFFFE